MKDSKTPASAKGARLSLRAKPTETGSAETAGELNLSPSCLQLKHILVPTDFSEPSEKALRYAGKFAEQFGAKVTLLHVLQPMVYPADFGYPPTVLDTLEEPVRRQVQERLDGLAKRTTPPMHALVRMGQPYHEITAAAKELEVDLIIISTHGRTGIKHVLLGSTAERVVRHAPCPVLTVREREHDFI